MDRFDELLDEWESRRDRGAPVAPDELCRDDPTLVAALTERIRLIEQFDRLFGTTETATAGPAGPDPGLRPPERVGRYQVRRRLGQGGMGVVYLARDTTLDRLVAVKTIRPERLALAPEGTAARFAQEGRVLARLAHRNIVAVFEGGSHDGCPYLAMEYVPGGSLADDRERIRAGGPVAVARLVEQVARAVHFAHAQEPPVLHRDLKPSNILLAADWEPKVADFGLAKLLTADPPEPAGAAPGADTEEGCQLMTAGGRRAGTPGYMAPEQADPARGPVGPAADVWAIGVTLHELLTGVRPSPVVAPCPRAVARAVPGRLGRRLAAVVAGCLREAPGERYRTAAEVADALGTVVRPSRRRVTWVALASALLVFTAWAVSRVDWEAWRYQRSTARRTDRLARGESVRAVGPGSAGRPLYRVRAGEAATTVRVTDGNGLRVESNADCSLVEFLTLDPAADVTVRAVVRLNQVLNNNNKWGVYVNHHATAFGGRTLHYMEVAGFTDPAERKGSAAATLVPWVHSVPAPNSDDPPTDHESFIHRNASGYVPAEGVREVAVRVRPSEVAARLGAAGRSPLELGPLTPIHRYKFGRVLAARHGSTLDPPPGRPGGVGLCVRHCCVTVLEFRVIPESPLLQE